MLKKITAHTFLSSGVWKGDLTTHSQAQNALHQGEADWKITSYRFNVKKDKLSDITAKKEPIRIFLKIYDNGYK